MKSTKKIRITFSANQAWSLLNFRKNLIKKLLLNGIEVSILAPADDSLDALKNFGCIVYDLPIRSQGVNPVRDIFLIIKYYFLLKKINPSLFISYTIKPNIYGSIAAKLAGVKSLAISTGLGYTFIHNNIISKVARSLYRLAFKYPDEIWFLNNEDLNIFVESKLAKKNKVYFLKSEGIDTNFFLPLNGGYYKRKFTFLFVGRLLWDKGVGEFIAASQMAKERGENFVFQILGPANVENPSSISNEQIFVWHNKGVIEYLGVHSDVRMAISNADCIVLPSYREGAPRILLEAAAMAKPVIASDIQGCREIVLEGITGFLCRLRDSEDLFSQMLKIANLTENERMLMGINARKHIVDNFSENLVVQRYFAYFSSAIHGFEFDIDLDNPEG